jgi:recombination protein RecR
MEKESYSSKVFNDAVQEFSKFPGIGKKTAVRLALHLLKQDRENIEQFGNIMIKLAKEIKHCSICHNISDTEICPVCSDISRDRSIICVVENIKDVIAIENTQQFMGIYHVLGGILSPMEGIGPSDLNIASLESRVQSGGIREIILALSPTMEGDTTNFYIYRKLNKYEISLSTIARGVSFGDELEYADELTLGRSIINRQPFDGGNF